MITSPASPQAIATIRHLAGPAPAGSRLTKVERLHLIYLLGAMMDDRYGPDVKAWTARLVTDQLKELGMSKEDMLELFDDPGANYNAVEVANRIAVHPSLKSADYLD